MVKYFAQDILDALSSHIEHLQRTLNIYEPQVGQQPGLQQGLMRSHKATEAINEATHILAQLLGSRNLLKQQLGVLIATLDELPLGVIVLDETTQVVLFNKSAERMFGLQSPDVPVENWPAQFGLYASEREEALLRPEFLPFFRTIATKQQSEAEIFARTRTSPEGIWLKMSAHPLAGPQSTAGAICIVSDITSQRLKTRLLKAGETEGTGNRRADLILENSSEAFLAVDAAARITDWNKAAELLLGFQPQAIIGQDAREFLVPQAYRTLFDASLGQLFEKGRAGLPLGRAELPVLDRDGKEHIIKVAAFHVSGNGCESLAGFFEDVTSRNKLELLRNTRYAVTRLITESATMDELAPKLVQSVTASLGWTIGLVWAIDPSSRALRLQQYWHQSPRLDAFVRRSQELLIPRGSEGSLTRVWASGESGWTTDIAVLERDPQSKLAESAGLHGSVAFPIISNWELQGIVQFLHSDVMDRNEELLLLMKDIGVQVSQFVDATRARSARQRLSAIVDSSTDGLISVNLAGVITGWNAGAQSLYGYEPISIVGKDVSVLFAPDSEQTWRQILSDVRAHRITKKGEFRHVTQRNEPVDVELTVFPVLDGAGNTVSIGLSARDIGERKQRAEQIASLTSSLEEQSRRLALANEQMQAMYGTTSIPAPASASVDKFKNELIPRISREAKTPMNAIMGLSEVLSKSKSLSLEEREYLSIIHESGQALLNVFNDLSEYAKFADGLLDLDTSDFSPSEVIEAASDAFIAQPLRKKLALSTFVSPALPLRLRGDAEKLTKIILQLLECQSNTSERGGIMVCAELEREESEKVLVRIEVSDLSSGLNALGLPHGQDRVGDEKAMQSLDAGKFGASLTRHLVGAMGGTIGRRAAGPDSGPVLWSVIPFSKTLCPALEHDPAFSGRKILALEGPGGVARIMRLCADAWGLDCDVVFTADEAFSALRCEFEARCGYDLVVVESAMYGMSGLAALSAIRSRSDLGTPDIIYYAPSADDWQEEQIEALKVGRNAVLHGPLKQSELYRTVHAILAARPLPEPKAIAEPVILIVDDNLINRKVTGLQIESLGLATHIVSNGQDAIEAFEQSSFALIVLDCEMPDMDGFAVAQKIRQFEQASGRRTPIVAITSHASEAERQLSIDCGMDEYVEQPVETETFASLFKKWIPAKQLGALLNNAFAQAVASEPFAAASGSVAPGQTKSAEVPGAPVAAAGAQIGSPLAERQELPPVWENQDEFVMPEAVAEPIMESAAPCAQFDLSVPPEPDAPVVQRPSESLPVEDGRATLSESFPSSAAAIAEESVEATPEPEEQISVAQPQVQSKPIIYQETPPAAPGIVHDALSVSSQAPAELSAVQPQLAPIVLMPFAQPQAPVEPSYSTLHKRMPESTQFEEASAAASTLPEPLAPVFAELEPEPQVIAPQSALAQQPENLSAPVPAAEPEAALTQSAAQVPVAAVDAAAPPLAPGVEPNWQLSLKSDFWQEAAVELENTQPVAAPVPQPPTPSARADFWSQAAGLVAPTAAAAPAQEEAAALTAAGSERVEPPSTARDEAADASAAVISSQRAALPSAPTSSRSSSLPSADELMAMGLDELQAMAEKLLRGGKDESKPAPTVQVAPQAVPQVPEEPMLPEPFVSPLELSADATLSRFDYLDLEDGWTETSVAAVPEPVQPVAAGPAAESPPAEILTAASDDDLSLSALLAGLSDSALPEDAGSNLEAVTTADSADNGATAVASMGSAPSALDAAEDSGARAKMPASNLEPAVDQPPRHIDLAANMTASSLFGADDDDDEMTPASRTELETPPGAGKQPSAELAALFDSVMDEELKQFDRSLPEETKQTAAPQVESKEIAPAKDAESQRAAFLSELKALEEPERPAVQTEQPVQSHHNKFLQELSEVAAKEAAMQRSRFEAELLALDSEESAASAQPPALKKMPSFADLLQQSAGSNGHKNEAETPAASVQQPAISPSELAESEKRSTASEVSSPVPERTQAPAAPEPPPQAEPLPLAKSGRAWPTLPARPLRQEPAASIGPEPPPAVPASNPAPEAAEVEADSPVMDLARLEKICGLDGMRDIVLEFVSSAKRLVERLEASIVNRNDDDRRRIAQELSGSCSALGAKRLQEMAVAMLMVPGDDWELSYALLVRLKEAYEELKSALGTYTAR